MPMFFKTLFISVIIFLTQTCLATTSEFNAPTQSFEKVFDVSSYTRDQIFIASKIWIAQNFKSAKAVIEYESKEEGTIIGNGLITYPCKGTFDCLGKADWKVSFTMRIDIKDGKFRLTFSNVGLVWPAAVYNGAISAANNGGQVYIQKDRTKIQDALLLFGPLIQESMSTANKDDNW